MFEIKSSCYIATLHMRVETLQPRHALNVMPLLRESIIRIVIQPDGLFASLLNALRGPGGRRAY